MVTETRGLLPGPSAATTSAGTRNPVAVLPPSSIVVRNRYDAESGSPAAGPVLSSLNARPRSVSCSASSRTALGPTPWMARISLLVFSASWS